MSDEFIISRETAEPAESASSISREALYALVWGQPMLEVAKRFGVSSSYMARVCTRLRVPRPDRGYWAKVAAGKTMARPPLPPARPDGELEWLGDGSIYTDEKRLNNVVIPVDGPSITATIKRHTHPLIHGTKALIEAGRTPSWDHYVPYLKPSKRRLVDITSTKSCLHRILAFANAFFLSLEAKGHRVVLAPYGAHFHRKEIDKREVEKKGNHYHNLWSPDRPTVVYIGTLAIGLSIIEMSEDVPARYVNGKYIKESEYVAPKQRRYVADSTWSSNHEFGCGRLKLRAYLPRINVDWSKQWQEAKGERLENNIPSIIEALEKSAPHIIRLIEEANRQEELRREQWEEENALWKRREEERRRVENTKNSKNELVQIINTWAESLHVERFLFEVEKRSDECEPLTRQALLERVRLARELLGARDPIEALQLWKAPHER